jgi:hypothetical protein
LVALLAIGGALVLVAGFLLWLWLRPTPVVVQSWSYASPDGQWQATLEEIDNGLGMGLGVLYDEVHVHKPGPVTTGHGDSDRSVIFYVDSEAVGPPLVQWTGNRHLSIVYQNGPHEPGKKLDRIADVAIEYSRHQ